jgi:hypothetical protein
MIFLPFALSLSSTFTKIGAVAAFAALVGIAALSLLVFSQARELKRLREWAGRAPERAADLEQRVTSAAAVRVQQQQPVQPVRPVPRAAPAPVAAANAAGPATRVVGPPLPIPGAPVPVPAGQPLTVAAAAAATPPGAAPAATPGAPPQPATAVPGAPAVPAPLGQPPAAARPGQPATPVPHGAPAAAPPPAGAASPAAMPASPPVGTPASVAGAAQSRPIVPGAPLPELADPRQPAPPVSAPATAAAAASAAARAPSPPRPPAPPSAARAVATAPPARAAAAPAATMPPPLTDRSVYAAKRPRGKIAAILGGAVVLVAAAVVAVSTLGGSSGPKLKTGSVDTGTIAHNSSTKAKGHSHKPAAKQAPPAPTVSPAETNVAVLNATEAEGLAHRTASELQQNGYSQATALNGKPPGSGQVSVVEYASGHQAEAEAVARSASITHVLPIEAAVTALASSANVVVIVGQDKVAQGQ